MSPSNDFPKGRVGTDGVSGLGRENTDSPGDSVVGVASRLVHIHGLTVGIGQGDSRASRHLEKESYQPIQTQYQTHPHLGCGLIVSG